jgi:hypothetical protein
MRKATLLFAGLLATGLIAAGCGGDDDNGDDGNGGEALTKQEFIAQADQICVEGDREIDAQAEDFFSGGPNEQPSPEEIEGFGADVVVPGIQEQIDGIRGLTPPEEDQEQVTEFLDTAQEALDRVEADPSLIGPRQEEADPFAETTQLARDLGLQRCAA